MAKDKVVNKNQPKSLTSAQHMFVEQLQARFGEQFTNVKRNELLKASQDILKAATIPAWIARNLKVRNKEKRGRYDLSVLLKLPVVAFEEVKTAKVKKTPKVAAKKATKAPKVPKTTKKTKETGIVDTETALADLNTPAVQDDPFSEETAE